MSSFSVTPWTVGPQVPFSIGFPRQEYWSRLPFPSPGELPDPGIKLMSPASPGMFLPLSHQGRHISGTVSQKIYNSLPPES